jgi:hypothetical protein
MYSVTLSCAVYCLDVNVSCTTATGCQPNCSKYMNSNKSTFNLILLVAVNKGCNKIFTADVGYEQNIWDEIP